MLKLMDKPATANAVAAGSATSAPAGMPALPCEALDNLGARFCPGGLFLLMLRPDGSVAYQEPGRT